MAKRTNKEKLKIEAEKRKTTGRKVKKLRREGILPANIYGKKVKSLAVQVNLKSFSPIFKQAGETGLVEVKVKGETKIRPALIHNVQLHPVTGQPVHADFYQVDLKAKVTTEVPIELVGESPAVKEKSGILIQPLAEVEVEALPADLPDKLEVNIGELQEIDDTLTVGDLEPPKGVKVLTGIKEVLAKVQPPAEEEEITPPAEEEVPSEEGAEAPEEEKPAQEAKTSPEGEKPEAKEEDKKVGEPPTKEPQSEQKKVEKDKEEK